MPLNNGSGGPLMSANAMAAMGGNLGLITGNSGVDNRPPPPPHTSLLHMTGNLSVRLFNHQLIAYE